MHIPDGFLNDSVSSGFIGASVAIIGVSLYKLRKSVFEKAKQLKLATNIVNGDWRRIFD